VRFLLLPAGIISAANNGKGVTGVVPGMPIIALKVLNKDGSGTLSTIYTALAHVLSLLKSGTCIAAVNMSLTMNDGQSPPDPTDQEVTCKYIRDISAYGTAVVVAAGAPHSPGKHHFLHAGMPSIHSADTTSCHFIADTAILCLRPQATVL
jgi:subtilisin family serine protease